MNPIGRTEPVCRNLFGPVDHKQLHRDFKLKLKELTERDSRRWNFNFESETPLPGRFQWEEVPVDCTATFYQEPARLKDAVAGSSGHRPNDHEDGAGADQENRSGVTYKHKCPTAVMLQRRKRPFSKSAVKLGDARITDYFPKRRRTTETKSVPSPLHVGSNEAALCKTLR